MDHSPGDILKKYWGYPGFRGSQEEIIRSVAGGRDVVAMLPTGGGKSLCYQVPGLLMPGVCLVISPLLALMDDQVADLKSRGIRALSLSGPMSQEALIRLLDNVEYGQYNFLYLSPERLQQELVISRIKNLPVNMVAVDEAHCISQWGYDFRPAYLQCALLRELHPHIPFMALTATATREVLGDISKNLNLRHPVVYRESVQRANITYTVVQAEDKNYRLRWLLKQHPGSAIVYVSTRRSTVAIADLLTRHGYAAAPFHGGLSVDLKTARLREWQEGKVSVMVATNAFGMGIDKADVRLVAHYEIPETIEHYYQEAGRAGRDGEPASAALIMGPADLQKSREQYLGNLPAVPAVLETYLKLNSYFGIPYGEMPETPFPIRLADFCSAYSLSLPLTYNAMEILDRQGVISLSRQFWQKTEIQFICSKTALWNYLNTYPRLQPAVQTLLRTYGGLFDFETPVNLTSVARKSKVPEADIGMQLSQLNKDGLIRLQIAEGDLSIRFLVPREDEKTIYAFAGQLEERLRVKKQKVQQMGEYLGNDRQCRQVQLMAYFGEDQARPCGHCDVCRKDPILTKKDLHRMRERILATLQDGPKTSREILEAGDLPEIQVLSCLQALLHEGILIMGIENQYSIK